MTQTQAPIAVIGMACRFPGAPNLEAYWDLLRHGRDAIAEVPPSRWSWRAFHSADGKAVGRTHARWGGFIDEVDRFDAAFFGMSPRETIAVSPQQRLLLEVAWHAVEDAGIPMSSLATRISSGSGAGVYVGVSSFDYYDRAMQDANRMDGYALTGNAYSVTANRLSYVFNLQGPSVAVDTACSSSLVAVHLAAQSLHAGECSIALAGGAQVMLSPWITIAASKGEFLAPDGRCKTFDARANGYVRGEGLGLLVLKRLSDAERDGDAIWGVIRGTAVNQDGRSNGLTAPNPNAQVDVVTAAWQRAGVDAKDVGYIEAHGTGTQLGDSIELRALGSVLGKRSEPCYVGSVKTNFGHLEAAAGIAGLIKALLCVHHGQLVPHLHFDVPNPLVDFARLPLRVSRETQSWSHTPRRIAGVSSFGFGGTNAHVVIEAAPARNATQVRRAAAPAGPALLLLSARSRGSLAALARTYGEWFERHPSELGATAFNLQSGREPLSRRVAVVAGTGRDAAVALADAATRLSSRRAEAASVRPKLAFLFTGQGSQYPQMGAELLERFEPFRETWRVADATLQRDFGYALSPLVYGPRADEAALARTEVAQPALFVLQIGLMRILEAAGVMPRIVLGHSVGEIAAAVCAGRLEFESGLRLVMERARAMQRCERDGGMLALCAGVPFAERLLTEIGSALVIAAINAPDSVVLSGSEAALRAASDRCEAAGVHARRLNVSHAFHSPAMLEAARSMRSMKPLPEARGAAGVRFISSMSGRFITGEIDWRSYWADQIVAPVQFHSALIQLAAERPTLALEIGPRPVLSTLARGAFGPDARIATLLEPGHSDVQRLLLSLGLAFESGVDARDPSARGERLRLPAYPFEPTLHPLYPPVDPERPSATPRHAFLERSELEPLAGGGTSVRIGLGPERCGWLRDHSVFGADVLPATGYIELAQAAAWRVRGTRAWRLEQLEFRRPLTFGEDERRLVVNLHAAEDEALRFEILDADSREQGPYSIGVVAARVEPDADVEADRAAFDAARARCGRNIPIDDFYQQVADLNIVFGHSFRAVREMWRGEQEAMGRVSLGEPVAGEVASYIHHPVFLDACLQLFGATLFGERSRKTFLPVAIQSFHLRPEPTGVAWSHVRLRRPVQLDDKDALADFVFYDLEHRKIGELVGLSLRLADPAHVASRGRQSSPLCTLSPHWRALDATPAALPPSDLAVLGAGPRAAALRAELGAQPHPSRDTRGAALVVDDDALVPDASAPERIVRELLAHVRTLNLSDRSQALRRLWFVTTGTQQVTGFDPIQPVAGLVWGFARSLEREYPHLTVTCVDDGVRGEPPAAAAEMLIDSSETMVAYRGGRRHVCRFLPRPRGEAEPMRLETYTLAISAYGSTDNLHFVPLARSQPGEREVEIEVRATGLNFKDVLHALGMLEVAGSQSGVDNASQMAFGGDCSGVVTRVGAKVTRIRPGDEVTAIMAFGCFASHVVVPEHFVATKPAGWSHVEAAAVPTAYATAYHSLVTCARLRREETVLIHAAAGGVGLAATQLALQIGAKVYATASRSKHALLRALGVAHIYDSRSVSFADEMQRDGAAPVDVVLNSLNGAFIQPTLRALRPGGRFVEIGKIGVMTPDEAARARPDIDYFLFDLMDVALRDPDSVVQALNASLSLLVRERLRPVRTERFPISQVKRAFRRMAEGRHAGKIVVTHPDRTRGDGVDAEGWQVLSGGLGGIGRELAHWLARHGARRIAFISRRAPGGAVWDELQSRCGAGVVLRHYAADVADQQKLRGVLASLAAEAPIADIHHLAGALHDGLLEGQTFDDFADVFRSKLISGLNLHAASLEVEHARFIAHSSVAGVFGSAGQTNYAAANAALDALMQHRRALGLHGLSVNWGPWGHAGMATRLREVDRQRLERDGVTPLSPDEALSELQSLVAADADRAVVGRIDWNRANSAYPGGLPPCLQDIDASGPGRTDDVMALSSLVELPEQERVARMTDATRLLLSPVLRLPPEDISPAATLPELGLDSLMGMEFRHRLERWIGRPIPIASLIRGPSVSDLAAELLALAALTPQAHRDTGVGPARVASRWLLRIGGPQTDAPRLLCFHHLGGGADFFRRWAEPLLDVCEVFAVELPGRNARASESLIATTDVLYDAITPIIATWPARPLLLYGHSMGSHLAFGCAQRLSALRCPPAHLFISGLWAPIDHHHEREAEHLGGRDLQHIEIPAALRLDAAFMKSLRTLIRSDAALLRSADWQGAPPLHVPLTAFSGLDDPVAPGDKVARWAKCTKAAFEHIELPGRHMFIVESAPAIHERIRLALGELPSADLHAAQRLVR